VGIGVIFTNPCTTTPVGTCSFVKDTLNLNSFAISFANSSVTGEGENLLVVSASASAAQGFPPTPRTLVNPFNPALDKRNFFLGELVFGSETPGAVIRLVNEGDPAFDELLSIAGVIGGDASAPDAASGVIDFSQPGNIYTVVPEPGSMVLLGAALAGLAFLRRSHTA
jgi:hypothetical protein